MDHFDLVQSFLERRERRESISTLSFAFQVAVETFGARSFAIGGHVDPDNPPSGVVTRNTYLRKWVKTFSELRYYETDPVFTYAERHRMPFFWNDARFRAQLGRYHHHREILAAANAFGITHGFTIPLHGRGKRGEPPASCSLVLDSGAMDRRSCFIAQLLAAIFYRAACDAANPGRTLGAPIRLSKPERECLELAALGLTDWRISELLLVSESTVQRHIRQAMRRFGMPTRELAVAQALALRHIRFGDVLRPKETNESRIAHEAAYWLMLLDEGELDRAAHAGYARWLAESPAHVEALELLQSFCNSLRENSDFLSRGQWRMH